MQQGNVTEGDRLNLQMTPDKSTVYDLRLNHVFTKIQRNMFKSEETVIIMARLHLMFIRQTVIVVLLHS